MKYHVYLKQVVDADTARDAIAKVRWLLDRDDTVIKAREVKPPKPRPQPTPDNRRLRPWMFVKGSKPIWVRAATPTEAYRAATEAFGENVWPIYAK